MKNINKGFLKSLVITSTAIILIPIALAKVLGKEIKKAFTADEKNKTTSSAVSSSQVEVNQNLTEVEEKVATSLKNEEVNSNSNIESQLNEAKYLTETEINDNTKMLLSEYNTILNSLSEGSKAHFEYLDEATLENDILNIMKLNNGIDEIGDTERFKGVLNLIFKTQALLEIEENSNRNGGKQTNVDTTLFFKKDSTAYKIMNVLEFYDKKGNQNLTNADVQELFIYATNLSKSLNKALPYKAEMNDNGECLLIEVDNCENSVLNNPLGEPIFIKSLNSNEDLNWAQIIFLTEAAKYSIERAKEVHKINNIDVIDTKNNHSIITYDDTYNQLNDVQNVAGNALNQKGLIIEESKKLVK